MEAVLYDVLGRRLAVLAEGPYPAGHHTLTLDGAHLPLGVYVVAVTARPVSGAERRSGAAPVAVGAQRLTITR